MSIGGRTWAYGAGVALTAVLVGVVILAAEGELAPVQPAAFDPGALVRYALPLVRTVHDLAAALTVGATLTAAFFVAPLERGRPASLAGPRRQALRLARGAAATWTVAGLLVVVLTAADVAGLPLGAPGSGAVLFSFVTQVDLGRSLAVSVLLAAVVLNLLVMATRLATVAWASGLSVLALLPLALAGHAAGSQDHMNSVDSLALHLVGVCLWVGGLAALLALARRLGPQLPAVVQRYSTLAGICFGVVAVSGVINAMLRLGTLANLGTTYGWLVVGKTVALVLLGVAGFWHRRLTIPRLATARSAFVRLAAVEVAVMAATVGLAVALSRSAPPVPDNAFGDPVAGLLGYPAPPPLTVGRFFTAFYPETLWLAVAAALLALYVGGAVRLARRGDRWPVGRTVSWVLGCLLLVFLTSGGPGLYGRLSFSAHMIQHMSLMVAVPLLWVLGAPVTMALRTLRARTDGSFGPRELLLALVHSRVLGFLGHPLVAVLLFIGSLTVFYYSPLFQLAMFTHTGHVLMTAHFLLTGYLFIWSLIGTDPGPSRPPYPFRLVLLLMTLGFHAFFGIALMNGGTLLAPDWWHALGQTDDAALLADQQRGGGIAWGAGDLPSLLLGVALVASWVRSDAAETRRLDRRADRDGDAELRRYNERLAAAARRDQQP